MNNHSTALDEVTDRSGELALIGSEYQAVAEELMFRNVEGADSDDNVVEELSADVRNQQEKSNSAFASVPVDPLCKRLRSDGFDAVAEALEGLRDQVDQTIHAIDISGGLHRDAAESIGAVFDTDLHAAYLAILQETNRARGIDFDPAAHIAESDLGGGVLQKIRIRPYFRSLVSDEDGYLLVGPSFPTWSLADEFLEELASQLRTFAADEFTEIAPRSFRSPHSPGEDWPGRDEWIWLYHVTTVKLLVGTMADVVAAWKDSRLNGRQFSVTEMFNNVYSMGGYGGFF